MKLVKSVNMNKKYKLLILSRGVNNNYEDNIHKKKYELFNDSFYGDIIHVVNYRKNKFKENGGMNYRGCYFPKQWMKYKFLLNIYFFIWTQIHILGQIFRCSRYDVIVAREPMVAGLVASFSSFFYRIPLVTEFNGNYLSDQLWTEKGLMTDLKQNLVSIIVPRVVRQSAAVKLLYPSQLDGFRINENDVPIYTFHDYVPVSDLKVGDVCKSYFVLLGGPLYLKGADVLIKAYLKICSDFPEVECRIYGWSYDGEKKQLNKLIGECSNIKIYEPVTYSKANQVISEAMFFVLPSRTEAMGRVMLEAMAFSKAVVGSNVDGIPYYLEDGVNGFVFDSESVEDLSSKLEVLLRDSDKREAMGRNGRKIVLEKYSEKRYIEQYTDMIHNALRIRG
jgi:glycosyltransferase involved in cell wall biosynthesis